ncbi:hypothetical protein BGZ63DRAFT_364391 [Mariannaea sp. PMI_226]|nr:hypothetical protein BGZ63DRAFT_364391 [Mariannaea sp. PMI_226]
MQSPSGPEDPRARGDETSLPSDGTRNVYPIESQTSLLTSSASPNTGEKKEYKNLSRTGSVFGNIRQFWEIYEKKTWSMYLFLFAGTIFAVGHHLFYESLDGIEVENQSLMLRYGTILAFCAKASLSTAVIMARRQRVWMVVRHKLIRLGTIDSMFTATEDITALFDWKAIQKARLATCLAIYVWATPLIVILASQTLSVVGGTQKESSFCPEARTLNFSLEATFDWRKASTIDEIYQNPLADWYSTTEDLEAGNPNSFDYFCDSSSACKSLVEKVVNLPQAAARKDAAAEVCTTKWNCSYTVEFIAPGYVCKELASGIGAKVKELGANSPPFGTSDILPEGNFSYLAQASLGDYAVPQIAADSNGKPDSKPPYPKNLGAFRTEPIIWIGYATVKNYSHLQPADRSAAGWHEAYTPVIIGCEHYEMKYKIKFEYTNGIQSYEVMDRKQLRRVIDTDYVPKEIADDGTRDKTTASPASNYVFPNDLENYRRVAAYHALGKQLRNFLNGTIRMPHYVPSTDFLRSKLSTLPNFLPQKDLHKGIQELYEDIVVSLLSYPSFVAVSWANNDSVSSGINRGGNKTRYPCIRTRSTALFEYNMAQLGSIYIVSIALALVGVLLGVQAAHQEGSMRDVKPSSIIEAARARSLNEVQLNGDQGIRGIKVGFGLVLGQSGGVVRGFGLAGDVSQEPRQRPWQFGGVGKATPSEHFA